MSDDWDDWDDDDHHPSDAGSEGWDWPSETSSRHVDTDVKPGKVASQLEKASLQSNVSCVLPNKGAVDERGLLEKAEKEGQLSREEEELTEKFFVELRGYLEDVVDPTVREDTNKELQRSDFSSLATYYVGRDDLANYTIETELQRMQYTIIDEAGDPVNEGDAELTRNFLACRKGQTLVRMANQSIFADMLQTLHGRLLRPELEISVVSRECKFSLDFARGVLDAQSLFAVSTVGGGEPGTGAETLEIANVKGTARVDTCNEHYEQRLLTPQLRMVFDDDMRASARVLARHMMMSGDVNGNDDHRAKREASGGWGAMGVLKLQGVGGAITQSLVRAGSGGMGRTAATAAAAAGSGLLANVVAGVGSAIGASKTTAPDDDPFGLRSLEAEISSRKIARRDSVGDSASPQRGDRSDDFTHSAGSDRRSWVGSTMTAAPPGDLAKPHAPTIEAGRMNVNLAGGEHELHARLACSARGARGVASPEEAPSAPIDPSPPGNEDHVPEAGAVAGNMSGTSGLVLGALGKASATGGAVLRSLWAGGYQETAHTGNGAGARAGAEAGASAPRKEDTSNALPKNVYRRKSDASGPGSSTRR